MNALCVSDLQIPFEHRDALDFVLHVKKVFFDCQGIVPVIVNMGDEVDQYTLSNYVKSPKARGANEEFEESKLRLKPWFDAFPKTFVCISNHTYRVYKRADEAGIPSAFMKTIGQAYDAPPGWQWRDKWIHDNICFEHGEQVSGQLAAIRKAMFNRISTVIGHQHSNGGVIHLGGIIDTIWGMNTGCLIDIEQYAFDYGKALTNKPTIGCGVLSNSIPYFVPMILNQERRWVGRI
jgi:hypothetical protein